MHDEPNSDELIFEEIDEVTTPENEPTVIVWSSGSGESTLLHLVQVAPTGIAWLLNIKKPKILEELVEKINAQPENAAAIIAAESKGKFLPRAQLARVSYSESLKQLLVVDQAGKKQKFADGKEGEQRQLFEAVREHLGGDTGEEEADAWSVMQGPLIGLAITAFFGGLMIFIATDADPGKEFHGRRSGLKKLFNWLGYTIGPTWMGIIVGAIALGIFGYLILQLVKRPVREFLAFKPA